MATVQSSHAHAASAAGGMPPHPQTLIAPPAPPKAPPPRKARTAAECKTLEQLPNIGPAIAADLRRLGVQHPQQLAELDALQLYQQLCRTTGKRQDPCVLDTFMAATDFMRGAAAKPWWDYTALRKKLHGAI
ncbi:MAG TPA: helix-hairpin-helix domain-containing protein [Rubrivivax sp.]|nr:helix-hairpin-helix domain-containing protein [Rubrivivax sp.]